MKIAHHFWDWKARMGCKRGVPPPCVSFRFQSHAFSKTPNRVSGAFLARTLSRRGSAMKGLLTPALGLLTPILSLTTFSRHGFTNVDLAFLTLEGGIHHG